MGALEICDYVVTMAVKLKGSAQMLLVLARSKNKNIIPFSFGDGAAKDCYYDMQYNLSSLCDTRQDNVCIDVLTSRIKFQNLPEYSDKCYR